jgi:hypothetical protein
VINKPCRAFWSCRGTFGKTWDLKPKVLHWIFFSMARQPYMGLGLLVSSRFHGHTHLRHPTVGRTPLDEGPARRRDLYLTTHNTHKRQTSMPPVGFDPTTLVSERPKTHALERTATGIGFTLDLHHDNQTRSELWLNFMMDEGQLQCQQDGA